MRPSRWLLDKLSHTLEPELRNAVMGDLAELKVPERKAVFELLGLILRRQAPLWRTWRPWLALFGIVGSIGVLLSLISVGVVSEIGRQALVYWQYGVPYSSGLSNAEVRPSDLHQWNAILLGVVLSMRSVRSLSCLGATPFKCLGSHAS